MTIFVVGTNYTREQIRAAVGLPPQQGGDWATGYTEFAGEAFVFCNIGVAGRTGHDYPNRWMNDALSWFGKSGSTKNQPMIKRMISGTLVTHIFWRGRDRAPFIYAGIGTVDGVWGEKPVEMLWRFAGADQPLIEGPPAKGVDEAYTRAFQHGPPPSRGLREMLAEDGDCYLYLMTLEGVVDSLFPALAPQATGRSVVKVGISHSPQRRLRELNFGFPLGAAAQWVLRTTRTFSSAGDAYTAEGSILQTLADTGRWISGEFAIIGESEVLSLLNDPKGR